MNNETIDIKSSIEVIKAKHGDCFIINCNKDDKNGTIVIDGGPTSCRANIKRKLTGAGDIDLMILTHFDDDHIGGLSEYIKSFTDNSMLPVNELWVNCAREIDFDTSTDISYRQAETLASYLSSIEKTQNLVWKEQIHCGHKVKLPFASIIVITPTTNVAKINAKKYKSYIEKNNLLNCSVIQKVSEDIFIPLQELSLRTKTPPNINNQSNLANMSSISVIVECDDLKLFMLGDAYPQDIIEGLNNLGYSVDNKIKVDYVKVSHHGSKNNTSNELLDYIDCDKYIISTNGGFGNSYHPSRETIANILCHPGRNVEHEIIFYLNYELKCIEDRCGKLINENEYSDYNFKVETIESKLE